MKLRFTVEILLNESWWFMISSFLLLSKCVFYRTEAILILAKTKKWCHFFSVKEVILLSFKLIVSLQGVSQKIQPTRMNDMFGVEISFLKTHSKIENIVLKFKHKELINLKKKVNLIWFLSMKKINNSIRHFCIWMIFEKF